MPALTWPLDQNLFTDRLTEHDASELREAIALAATVAGQRAQVDSYVATLGQTAFTLTQTPLDVTDTRLWVNGILYRRTVDYTVVATAVTWLNVPFVLAAGDIVTVTYNY